MGRRYIAVIILFFLVGLVNSMDVPFQGTFGHKEMWTRLGLKFDLLNEVLNEKNCSETKIKFLGCIKTLNFILSQGDQTLRLTTSDWIAKNLDPEEDSKDLKIVKDIGIYKLVLKTKKMTETEDRDLVSEYKTLKNNQKVRQDFWESFFVSQLRDHPLPIKEVEEYVKSHLIKKNDLSALVGEAYNVYLSSAEDAHAWIEPSETFELSRFKIEDDYFGVGIGFYKIRSQLAVKSLMRDAPAFKAGIRLNDTILTFNGKKTENLSVEQVENEIRNKKSDPLLLTFRHGAVVKAVKLVPKKVKLENVQSRKIIDVVGGESISIGYIRISSFMKDQVCLQVNDAITKLQQEGVKAFMLDVRNNGGGIIDEAVCVAGLFLGQNQEVVSVHTFDHKITKYISRTALATSLPLVTLINRNSASASEFLAGSFQDHSRSLLIGERSFGKGTIQNVGPWEGHQGLHRAQTVARFYLPGNLMRAPHTNQIYGIFPDIEAYESPAPKENDIFAFREADYSPIVLKEEGPELFRPNPLTEIKYRNCSHDFNDAVEKYHSSLIDNKTTEDYPMLVALEVLKCDLNENIVTKPVQKIAVSKRKSTRN
jgi:carboxyl-terminal processing protease